MRPRVKHEKPPNYEAIAAVFPLTGNEIFAYAPYVYIPNGMPISEALQEHEAVHIRQQFGDPATWWRKYLVDEDFRFDQELEAHRVEYRVFRQGTKDRNAHAKYLYSIGRRLASPMYGSMVTTREAMQKIRVNEYKVTLKERNR